MLHSKANKHCIQDARKDDGAKAGGRNKGKRCSEEKEKGKEVKEREGEAGR